MQDTPNNLFEYSYVQVSLRYWKTKIKNFGAEMMYIVKTVSWSPWKTVRKEFGQIFAVIFVLAVFFQIIFWIITSII